MLREFSHSGTLDERTFTACVQEVYRLPHGYIEDEVNEMVKQRKIAWRFTLQDIEKALVAIFPMMATAVGSSPNETYFLEINDMEMCM